MPADPTCRENPQRAIYINSSIDQPLVNSLTPQILKLRHENTNPITVYIDSGGGHTMMAETLLNLLEAPNADGVSCPTVTVATGFAASAAADFLATGGYVIAYPHATIHFHGTRREGKALTMESATITAKLLREHNEEAAMELAANIVGRSIFIYATLRASFAKFREKDPELTDVECFARALRMRLSPRAGSLPVTALLRYSEVQKLSDAVFSRKIPFAQTDSLAKSERSILRAIIDYEYRNSKKDPLWGFTDENLDKIVQDFRVIKDFHTGTHTDILEPLAKQFGKFFLTPEQTKSFETTKFENDAARDKWLHTMAGPRLQPLWYFIVSICRLLQEKENPLTAHDAYWLGIVNEVVGSGLRCIRQVYENPPKQKPTSGADSTTASTPPS